VTDEQLNDESVAETPAQAEEAPQYGVGPFTVREVALVGVWTVAFVVSFFSLNAVRFDSVWTAGLQWILTIGVPTVAVFLIVLRRLSPQGIRRVGSLGIDQFASVAFAVSTVVWLQLVWETVAVVAQGGPWLRGWVMWVSFVLMLAGVFLTTFAPFIAPFDADFRGRPEIPAHRNARPVRAVVPRPAPAPAPAAEVSYDDAFAVPAWQAAAATSEAASATETAAFGEPASSPAPEPEPEPAPVRHQAFWALAPEERDVVDEYGAPLFRVGPTAWALVIEDRGETFVVRHEDGRVGYLHDVADVTRG
jgi:hypothetical protein